MKRRDFINRSLLVGLASRAGNPFAWSLSDKETEVLVIGAGYAGLTAALRLQQAGKRVIVLEARERVGGRIWTQHNPDGTYFDLGGQWIGPGHDEMYNYARKYNVATFPTYTTGKTGILINDKRQLYKGIIPRLSLSALLNLNKVIQTINKESKYIDLYEPWNSPGASYWDGISARDWLEDITNNEETRSVFKIAFESVFAASMQEVSMLHVLFYTKSNQSFDFLINTEKGAQQDRIDGGAQTIANKIADELGESVRYRHPVKSIIQGGNKVTVSGEGFSMEAQRVIIAVPPPVAAKFEYSGTLAKERQALLHTLHTPVVYKCYTVYSKPFWRERGWNGMFTSPGLPVSLTFDNSTLHSDKGILVGFVTGQEAVRLHQLTSEDRRKEVLRSLQVLFGDEAARPITYLDKTLYDDPFTLGCYASVFPVNTYTRYTTGLATSAGRIHWAGTETSVYYTGYMEGAVRSGHRAANEVLEALN